jgi:hypothetical protein
MADDYTLLNLGTGGDALDEEGVTFGSAPTTRKRARVRVAGAQAAELQEVKNAQPASNAYGAVVREVTPKQGTLTDRSGTITAGGTAQNAIASNAARRYLLVRNPKSATESLWLSLVGTATVASPSLELAAGDAYVAESDLIPTNAVSLIAATTAHAFTVWEG